MKQTEPNKKHSKEKSQKEEREREQTRSSEANDVRRKGLSVNDDELERIIGSVRSEEAIERPLKGVEAVVTLIHSEYHNLLLPFRHFFFFCNLSLSRIAARAALLIGGLESEGGSLLNIKSVGQQWNENVAHFWTFPASARGHLSR